MTRKDFVLITGALNAARDDIRALHGADSLTGEAAQEGVTVTAEELAAALRTTNPAFNTQRFLKAAGCP